ncbi:MAG: hypothetical protein HQL06_07140 [Nitrospirae bacterium]|nr:hypothetical protein [Nitrospirota bacterium]
MRAISTLLWLTCLVLSPLSVLALTPEDFQYSVLLKDVTKANTLYRLHLTPDLLDKCSPGCNDLRLLDKDNNDVPYVILQDIIPGDKVETYALEITNYENKDNQALITMKMPDNYKPVSAIELSIADRDFNKKAVLYASRNGTDWIILAHENVYDFTSQINLRKTRIQFNASDYPLYYLILADVDMTEGGRPAIHLSYDGLDFSAFGVKNKTVKINAIKALTAAKAQQSIVYDQKVFNALPERFDDGKNTVVIVESSVPASSIVLEASNPYYYRKVDVYYATRSQVDRDPYVLYASHYVYNFPLAGVEATKDYFELPPNPGRQYKFVVNNNSNPPLIVNAVTLRWIKRNLFFVSVKDSDRYTLCFGNSDLNRPQYDIASFIRQDNYFDRPHEVIKLPAVVFNANYRPSSRQRREQVEKTILTVVVVGLVVLIGFWIHRLSKKTPW